MFSLFKKAPFALSISDNSVEVLQAGGVDSKPQIEAVGEADLEPGIVSAGQVLDRNKLAEALKNLLTKTKPVPITQKECLISLSEAQSYEYVFYLPRDLRGEDLKKALEQKIISTLPIPLSELHYDFVTCQFQTIQVVFTVLAKQAVVREYLEVMKMLSLKVISIEPESLSILRSLSCYDVNKKSFLVYAKNNSIIWFLLLNGLIFDSNSVATSGAADLVRDLQKTAQFFRETTGQVVENIFLAGAEEEFSELPKILGAFLPTTVCQNYKIPFNNLNSENAHLPFAEFNNGKFAVVAGAALRSFSQFNNVSKIDILKN